jgi:hypothetical protein
MEIKLSAFSFVEEAVSLSFHLSAERELRGANLVLADR